MAANNGKELRSKHLILSPAKFLNSSEKESLATVFLSETLFPVRDQAWLKDDVVFLLDIAPFLWGIRKPSDRHFIGYVAISEPERCFEILIINTEIMKGYGVYATLVALDAYFMYQPEITSLFTRIHTTNTPSFKQAIKFGWKYIEITESWILMILTKDEFYIRHKISIDRLAPHIPPYS